MLENPDTVVFLSPELSDKIRDVLNELEKKKSGHKDNQLLSHESSSPKTRFKPRLSSEKPLERVISKSLLIF